MQVDSAAWIAAAAAAGASAWDAFPTLVLIAIAFAGIATAAFGPGRQWWRGRAEPPPDPAALRHIGGRLAVGFVVVLATASVFALVARLLGDGRTLQRADEAFSQAVAAPVPAAGMAALRQLTHFGEPLVLIVLGVGVTVALWVGGQRSLASGWAAATGGNAVLNPALKQIFARARPLYEGLPSPAAGFSFPSGHSSGAMVAYGMLAYLAIRLLPPRWHIPAVMAATAIVLTTAFSRVFLQVHFASDVLAGLCFGAAWLTVCIATCEYARHRRESRVSR